MNTLRCPVCKSDLVETAMTFHCEHKHVFDKSRQGYVNLLLPHMRSSKEPGDNKAMVHSRAAFLQQGFYAKIAALLNETVAQKIAPKTAAVIADIGCGTGYYFEQLRNHLTTLSIPSTYYGVDISKEAILLAAKKIKHIQWLVSSIAELPFHDDSLTAITSVFSPLHFAEFQRTLRNDGYLYIIIPSPQHLYELRTILFDTVKDIVDERLLTNSNEHFQLAEKIPLQYTIQLTSSADIQSLFSMTPYYWRCTAEKKQLIAALDNITLTIDVTLWVFKKN
jgi:23S rRNA (guanine745-N1)-methyltransferase